MKIAKFAAVVTAAAGFAASANADTITAKFTASHAKSINITSPTLNGNVNTVKFNWTRQDGPGVGVDSAIASTFNSYCVDLAQVVSANTNYTYDVVSPASHGFSVSQTTSLQRLWADYFPSIDTADKSAAFQMAIWEIVYDTGFNLSSGSFSVSNAATSVSLASNWLGAVGAVNYSSSNQLPDLVVLESPTSQDQITVIPAPGTASLAGLALCALVSRRRRA